MKSYFEYILHTMCGIPAITLEGTVQDWQELANRAQSFAQFDLEWWITHLTPILREFVAAARGDVRPEFWESIYKFNSFSGGASITGWITAFFPYFTDAQGNATRKNRWLASGGGALELLLSGNCDPKKPAPEGPALGSFPSGLASAPFMWNYMGQSYPMEFLGGFVGIAQDPATLTLRPEIGWAVRQG
jgi:hypothetical protein